MIAVLVDKTLDSLKVNEFLVLLPTEQICVFADKLLDKVLGAFPLSFSPLVQNWLEEAFVELSHRSERGSSVEEVKLFIILFALVLVEEGLVR